MKQALCPVWLLEPIWTLFTCQRAMTGWRTRQRQTTLICVAMMDTLPQYLPLRRHCRITATRYQVISSSDFCFSQQKKVLAEPYRWLKKGALIEWMRSTAITISPISMKVILGYAREVSLLNPHLSKLQLRGKEGMALHPIEWMTPSQLLRTYSQL